MVSSLSSISFKCKLQQSQLIPWTYKKFWIDMHVFLLVQWDFHLPNQRTIILCPFLEYSLPTSSPITTCFTTRQILRCLFETKVLFSLVLVPSLHPFFLSKKKMGHGASTLNFKHLITSQSRISFQFLLLMSSIVLIFSPSWIFNLSITKLDFMRMTSLKQLFAHMMATMNFWPCHLASRMLLPHSKH